MKGSIISSLSDFVHTCVCVMSNYVNMQKFPKCYNHDHKLKIKIR